MCLVFSNTNSELYHLGVLCWVMDLLVFWWASKFKHLFEAFYMWGESNPNCVLL